MQSIDRDDLEHVTGGNFLEGLTRVFQSEGFQTLMTSLQGLFSQLGQSAAPAAGAATGATTGPAAPTGQAPIGQAATQPAAQ